MLKIKPVRGALALLLAVSLCLAMSLTAFLIDTPAMREHAEQAVDLLGYESASPEIVGGFASSRLDNYTAVLILKTAAYIGDDPLLRMAFSGLRTDLPPQEDQTDWEAYATYSDAVPSPNNVPYSRYWHGYTFALRLLLCLFTFTNLQMLLLFAQTALLLLTVLLMVRRGLQQLIPAFAVSWFFMSPPALGLCLQYAPVSLIALLACSLLLALKPALSRSVGLPVFFALIGLFVNYFDLLTFPVVSLSFPLILLIALETKTTISFGSLMREALLCCVGWALGYACMWMLKWGLNFLVLGQDGIAAVGDQISLRLSAGGDSHSRLDILLRSIRIVTDKTAYRVILLAVLALLLALFIRRRPRRFGAARPRRRPGDRRPGASAPHAVRVSGPVLASSWGAAGPVLACRRRVGRRGGLGTCAAGAVRGGVERGGTSARGGRGADRPGPAAAANDRTRKTCQGGNARHGTRYGLGDGQNRQNGHGPRLGASHSAKARAAAVGGPLE